MELKQKEMKKAKKEAKILIEPVGIETRLFGLHTTAMTILIEPVGIETIPVRGKLIDSEILIEPVGIET